MPQPSRRLRPLLAVAVASATVASALVLAATASAATPQEQVEQYAAEHGAGAAQGPFRQQQRYGRTITYRLYAKAVVLHNGKAVKHVSGAMRGSWGREGALRGTLGAPVTNKRCGVTGGGCIQRFQHGTIFRSGSAKREVSVSRLSGERSELVAVAASQVGYREPGFRKNRYGRWVNGGRYSNQAWCGIFMSWVSSASGNGGAIPKRKTFGGFVKAVKQQGRTSRTPRVGDLAFFDYVRDGVPSHVGLVVGIDGEHLRTIDGNTDARGGDGRPRGVFTSTRARSSVVFYATPDL